MRRLRTSNLVILCSLLFLIICTDTREIRGGAAPSPTAPEVPKYALSKLPPAGRAGRIVQLADGGALGALVIDDGSAWRCTEERGSRLVIITCPPYNANGDGKTDDTLAIQAAIDAVKGGEQVSPLMRTAEILFPQGVYVISRPLRTYSGLVLNGSGQGSKIKAATGFIGTALLQLVGQPDYYTAGSIRNLEFVSAAGSGIAAIKATARDVVNSQFERLYLNSANGILLDTYTQACLVQTVLSYGPVDKVIQLKGNFNVVRDVDKEGSGTGASADPYVQIEGHAQGASTGNLLENILIEGVTSANKSAMKLDGTAETILNNFWSEPTSSDGYALRITNSSGYVRVAGVLEHVTSKNKIQVATSREVYIERLNADGEDVPALNVIEIDPTSTVVVGSLQSRRGNDLNRIDYLGGRLFVEQHFTRQISTDRPTGYSPRSRQRYLSGQNLLMNPSFEAGRYGWTFSTPPHQEEYVQSEVGTGLMGHFVGWTGGNVSLSQAVVVPSAWVGQTLTFSILVKMEEGGWANPYLSGAGVAATTGYNRASSGQGWQIISQSFTPRSGGTLSVGAMFVGVTSRTEVWVDEAWLAFGSEGIINPAKFASIELGSKTFSVASAPPPNGTWKQGDVLWNSAPTEAGPQGGRYTILGWICLSGGTPGTWRELRVPTGG